MQKTKMTTNQLKTLFIEAYQSGYGHNYDALLHLLYLEKDMNINELVDGYFSECVYACAINSGESITNWEKLPNFYILKFDNDFISVKIDSDNSITILGNDISSNSAIKKYFKDNSNYIEYLTMYQIEPDLNEFKLANKNDVNVLIWVKNPVYDENGFNQVHHNGWLKDSRIFETTLMKETAKIFKTYSDAEEWIKSKNIDRKGKQFLICSFMY